MENRQSTYKSREELESELENLRRELQEANDTIEAIRTGQVDALVVQGDNGHQLYTLKSADQTYRVFIEKMTEGAVTLNRQGLVLYCNSQFASMVRRPLSMVIGVSFEDFIAPENKSQYSEMYRESWQVDRKGEVLLLQEEGTIPVQLSLTSLELDEGVSLSVILTDLSAQKTAQLQLKKNNEQLERAITALEASNHDLQQFASVASHDLQEPLRKIQVFAHLLNEKQSDLTPESQNYLKKIIDSSARMKALIIDVLNYSRLSSRNMQVEYTDLNELLIELQEDFELMIKEKAAELLIENLPCVEVNRGQIRQVFQNIVSNALKFTKEGNTPVIIISAKRIAEKSFDSVEKTDGDWCLITIQDNGIGFDEKYVENIFALFERLNSKDRYEGTGIGLSIARKIIEKHHGLITATSREGRGSEFMMILPIKHTQSLTAL